MTHGIISLSITIWVSGYFLHNSNSCVTMSWFKYMPMHMYMFHVESLSDSLVLLVDYYLLYIIIKGHVTNLRWFFTNLTAWKSWYLSFCSYMYVKIWVWDLWVCILSDFSGRKCCFTELVRLLVCDESFYVCGMSTCYAWRLFTYLIGVLHFPCTWILQQPALWS